LFNANHKVDNFINRVDELEDKIKDQEEEICILKLAATKQEEVMDEVVKSNSSVLGRFRSRKER